MDSSVSEPFRWWAYLVIQQPAHLCATTFAKLTSDSDFGNWDPNINWTMFGNKEMHSPGWRQFVASGDPVPHDHGKMALSNCLEHDCCMPSTVPISQMPYIAPTKTQNITTNANQYECVRLKYDMLNNFRLEYRLEYRLQHIVSI